MFDKNGSLESLVKWLSERGAAASSGRFARMGSHGESAWRSFVPSESSKGVVVLAHATGNDHLYPLVHLVKALITASWQVFTFDLDGHGKSSTTELSRQTIGENLTDALRELERRTDPAARTAGLHLIGQSLGGALCLDHVARASDPRIRSLVLMATPLAISVGQQQIASEALTVLDRDFWAEARHYGAWGVLPAFGPFKRKDFPVRIARSSSPSERAPNYIDVVRAIVAGLNLEEKAAKVGTPCLGIYGARDTIAPPADGLRLFARFAKGELVSLAGRNHFTTLIAPEATALIVDWLDRWRD